MDSKLALLLVVSTLGISVSALLVVLKLRRDILLAIKDSLAQKQEQAFDGQEDRLLHRRHLERLQDHVARGVQLLAKNCERTNNDGNDGRCDGDDHRMTGHLH